jgi:regulatory protein
LLRMRNTWKGSGFRVLSLKADRMRSRTRKPTALLDQDSLYEYAVKMLGQQMRTVAELKRLMRRRVEAGEAGEATMNMVVARLTARRYLNDASYAQDYAKLRQENASFGKRRVQQDLIRKGVQAAVIGKTLDAAYENVDEEELARRHLERKRVKKPANEKEAARVMRMLMRAGFSSGVIFRILKKWDVAVEVIDELDSDEGREG